MARSLSRNTQLFVSTNDNTLSGADPENLFEVKVLDGYSFSQDVSTLEVGVNEAGATPVRGTLAFNTALNPVDVSFSTYVRVHTAAEDTAGDTNAYADCVERVLWGSAMGDKTSWDLAATSPAAYAAANTITAQTASVISFGLGSSNTNTLMPLTLYFKLENTTYVVTDFNVATAEVDFSIDGIATINWSGQGSRVTESPSDHTTLIAFTGDTDYRAVPATTTTTFLRNKLSTLQLKNNEDVNALASQAVDTGGITGQVITLASVDALVDSSTYIGGRVRNTDLTPDEWATIISHTADAITVSDADDITNWSDADVLEVYTAAENAGVIYTVPITGATLTLENNFTYLTPEELAIVNLPLAGFSGSRVVSGSLTAYLNTGAEGSGGLLADMLGKIEESVSNNYELIFSMGGSTTATPRVDFTLTTCQLSIPTTNVEDLITTEISFTSKPTTGAQATATGSFEAYNELTIDYYDS